VLNKKTRTLTERRLILAAVSIWGFIGVFELFRQWPRGDTRFVGEWSMAAGDRKPSGKLVLCRNGTGSLFQKFDSAKDESIVWKVEDNSLIFGYPDNWMTRFVNRFWDWMSPGYVAVLPYEKCHPILEISDDTIQVANTWNSVTLRRIR
jgi:hypothetical protein